MKTYLVTATLFERTEADNEDDAFMQMMDMLEHRDGMEIINHSIEEDDDE